jgi:hypothetical protein
VLRQKDGGEGEKLYVCVGGEEEERVICEVSKLEKESEGDPDKEKRCARKKQRESVCEREMKAYVLVLLHIRHQSFCILIHLFTSMLGNCLYVAGEYARAKEIFLEAGPRSAYLSFFLLSFFLSVYHFSP